MQRPGDADDDSILDSPDSPPSDQQQSPQEAVITLSSSPESPGPRASSPIYSKSSSPCSMEVGQEHFEDCYTEKLSSPEKSKQTSHNEEKVFIFEEELKFFEAVTKSFEAKIGNPEICQAVVNENSCMKWQT